jgi:hypothetical protein
VELYRACGFKEIRRLVAFAGPSPSVVASAVPSGLDDTTHADLIEVDIHEVAQAVIRYGLPDLPWQLSGETLAQLTPPTVAYRLDGAWIALSDPSQPVVTVRGLIAEPIAQGFGCEARLLRAVMAKHPGRDEWRITATWPEELAGLIAPAGLPRSPLSQWQMQRHL